MFSFRVEGGSYTTRKILRKGPPCCSRRLGPDQKRKKDKIPKKENLSNVWTDGVKSGTGYEVS